MKRKITIFIINALLLIGSFFLGRYFERRTYKIIIPEPEIIEKVIIKNDSILKVNDSINFKVIEIEKTYEKTVDDIIRNNPHDDYNFFSDYIERYCGRYYPDSAQSCESDIR